MINYQEAWSSMVKFFISLALGLFTPYMLMANKLEVTANSIYSTNDTVHADEGVVVYYNNSIIKSKHATYNKKTKLLVLDEEVEVLGYEGTKEFTNHMELHTDTKEATFKQLFMSGDNDIWLLTNQAHRIEGKYHLGKSILSSCDVKDPLWKMVFSDSVYDSNEKYMKIYHARMYLGGVPIFYTPYLAFSTNKERSTGLLFPKIGYNPQEGVLYEQPLFINLAENMDIELNGQIRTKRSMGLYGSFRFVDSNHSEGVLRMGYFKDKQSYVDEFKPENDTHNGVEFNYESSEVFMHEDDDATDGFYLNTTYLNDIDYLNLQKSRLQHFGTRPRQESRLNYFLYNENYYAGINAKYFIDTREKTNDSTLQQLPSFQWHKFLAPLVLDNLTYSIDTHFNNVTRKIGATMRQAEIKVPVEYSTSFWNDYMNLSLKNEFYYSKYFFGNEEFKNDTFQYYSNIQKVALYTDLTKQYDEYIHVIEPSIEYVNAGTDKQSPIAFEELHKHQKKLFSVGLPEKTVSFGFKQYLYDESMHLVFSHRLAQRYYPDRAYKLSELENEIEYTLDDWTFYNYMTYSHDFNAIHAMASSIEIDKDTYSFDLGHTYKQYLRKEGNSIAVNDINFDFKYSLNQRIRMSGGFSYDMENKESKQWKMGIGYFKDCWSIDTSYRRDIRATSNGPETLNTFYLQLNFIPFGGVGTGDFE